MKTEKKNIEKNKIEIEFDIPWEEFTVFYQYALVELGKDITISGFRPGKAPHDVMEKQIGEGRILEEASLQAMNQKYIEYIEKEKIDTASKPEAEIIKLAHKNPFIFKIKVEVLPEIKLPDYKKIAKDIKPPKTEVSDEEVDNAIKWIQNSRAQFTVLDREAQQGDFIEIEYQSSNIENNKLFKDSFVLGKGGLIKEFEDNIAGMKKSEDKEFNIQFDKEIDPKIVPNEDLRRNLSGKDVKFKVSLKEVKEMKLPELNDEFIKSLGNFKTLEDMKINMKEGIKKEKEGKMAEENAVVIIEAISKKINLDIPETMIKHEKKHLQDDFFSQVGKEEYIKETGKKEEDIDKEFEEKAKKKIKEYLILREIGKLENVKVEEKELEESISRFLANFPDPEKVKNIDPERIRAYHEDTIFNKKVITLLNSYVTNSSNNN